MARPPIGDQLTISGPWILGPRNRSTQLLVGLLRSLGYPKATGTELIPDDGLLIVPTDQASRENEVRSWAGGAGSRRAAILEPAGGAPVPVSGVPRRLGQRRRIPPSPPAALEDVDDDYLSDVAALALTGYETRLNHGRPFPDEWRSVAARAVDELISKTDDPDSLKVLRGELGAAPSLDVPRDDEWMELLSRLDLKRGLFRRRGPQTSGWDLHPWAIWAIATRLHRYRPSPLETVEYGRRAIGSTGEPTLTIENDSITTLSAAVLTAAAHELDPPDLAHAYDFSDNAPPPPVWGILSSLPPHLRPINRGSEPFTLCVRHDVDRRLDRESAEQHLDFEDGLGLSSTWYFKRETFDPSVADILAGREREIGYHAELLSTGDDGFADHLREYTGAAVGVTFHGGLGSEGWRGRRSFEEAHRLGLAYAEMPVGMRPRPSLWPADDGWLPLAPLPLKPDVFPDRMQRHLETVLTERSLVIVENHPDLFDARYRSLLEDLAGRGPIACTVDEAIGRFIAPDEVR